MVIVSGLPGSGKSYFAGKLSRELGAAYVNSDQVRQEMHASGRYSFDDKLTVYREMARRTAKVIEAKKDVVIDATFYHHTMREMFVKLARLYKVPLFLIVVTADEPLIRQRLQAPREYSEADFSVYEKVRDEFEGIALPHLTLESTDSNVAEMLRKALQYIKYERA